MDQETDIESTRGEEGRTTGGAEDTIELESARSSLSDIFTRFPPEILGHIFVWAITRERDDSPFADTRFDGLERGSHNFLFVCGLWFEVAKRTPELWRSWGNTLRDWKKLCRFNRSVPVDLVLDQRACGSEEVLNISLRGELRDRVARDKIRRVHLKGINDLNLLGSIISSLTPKGEDFQEKCIESIILSTPSIPEELLDFFARSRLPRLRCLEITGVLQKPWWDHLTSQTTRLTTLSLTLFPPSFPLSTSQLISILATNPNLQHLTLSCASLPGDVGASRVLVPLHRLKTLSLSGEFCSIFRLLQQLDLPPTLEYTELNMEKSALEGVYRTLGPYMEGFFQRDARFQDKLDVMNTPYRRRGVCVDVVHRTGYGEETSESGRPIPSARFSVSVVDPLPEPVLKELSLDLMAYIPRGGVNSLQMEHTFLKGSEELLVAMPKLKILWLMNVTLSDGFLQSSPAGTHADRKLLPSLRSLILSGLTVRDDNWQPLINYLLDKAEDGLVSCSVTSTSEMPPEVMEKIQGLVKELEYSLERGGC